MFVIIADQVDSRHDRDHVEETIGMLTAQFGSQLSLPPERTAGDELQLLVADGPTALATALALVRHDHWRAGIGVGAVNDPLPNSVREASGSAFVAARSAIEAAERRPLRCAVRGEGENAPAAADLGALVDLILMQRSRWSHAGWELHDLLDTGRTQADAADVLGVTPQAVSKRARAAGLRVDADARAALGRLLEALDRGGVGVGATSRTGPVGSTDVTGD